MVYCIGNNNFDIFFDQGKILAGAPGGSMLNVAVSLGRMNVPVQLITRTGDDKLADILVDFLHDNHVRVDYLTRMAGKKTSLALAFLDKRKKPAYSFYGAKEPTPEFEDIRFKAQDILLFGSSYAIDDYTLEPVDKVIAAAHSKGVLCVYDPNIRQKCASAIQNVPQRVLKRMGVADIVKMSDEDLLAIGLNIDELIQKMPEKYFILTRGAAPVEFRRGNNSFLMDVPAIEPVNTTGAGDAFSAGIIGELSTKNITKTNLHGLDRTFWRKAIAAGIDRAASVCQSHENYLSKPTQ